MYATFEFSIIKTKIDFILLLINTAKNDDNISFFLVVYLPTSHMYEFKLSLGFLSNSMEQYDTAM